MKNSKKQVGRPKGRKTTLPPQKSFRADMIYTTSEAAPILRRSQSYVQKLCKMGRLAHAKDGQGYTISGRVLLAYVEGRCLVGEGGEQ